MRAIPDALRDSLASGATTLCQCWRLTRRDGAVLGFTDHDSDIVFDGVPHLASAALEGGSLETGLGLAADSLRIDGALSHDAIDADDIARGRYDGADIARWIVDWRAPEARLLTFRGRIGEITRRGEAFSAEVEGLSAALNRPLGRAYLRQCDASLGDARCGIDLARAAFRLEAAIAALEGARITLDAAPAFEDGWFRHGRLRALDGEAAGTEATLRDHRGALLELWAPMQGLAVGDRLSVTAGCDKSLGCCRTKFGNVLNFRGCPHLPGDDWIASYPTDGDLTDGGALNG